MAQKQTFDTIEEEAKWLAKYNKETNPDIQDIYWFPDDSQIRLVETTELAPYTLQEKEISPFYFGAFSDEDVKINHQLAIALIHPGSVKKLSLPEDWDDWESAKKIS